MKTPESGINKIQSFFDFINNSGQKVRFGIEGLKLFLEIDGDKNYLTNSETKLIGEMATLNIVTKTPINAIAASAVLTNDETTVTDGDELTIGTVVYTFKTVPAAVNDIAIGTATETMLSLFKAMTGTGVEGTDYFAGTESLSNVTAVHTSTFVITITSNILGVTGNAIAIAEDSTHLSFDSGKVFLSGGIDGTVGIANEIAIHSSYLYYCLAANTIADNNWRRISLGSTY